MMSSATTSVNGWTSPMTTDLESSTDQNNVMMPSSAHDSAEFTRYEGVTTPNSTSTLINNTSSAMMRNDSQVLEVDLEALNVSMTMTLMPTVLYLSVLMVVGLVGNIVVLLVYYRRFKPNATRTYVLAMSVCDLLGNVFSLPSEIIDIRYTFTYDLPWLCKCVRGMNSFLTITAAFLLVAVARDRFNKVCRPLKKRISMKRIKLYVLICALASLALSVVFGALNGSRTVDTGVGNTTGISCTVSDVFADTLFPMVYSMIMFLTFILCVVIMMVSYILIAVELWRHKKKQARVSGAQITIASPAKGDNKMPSPVVEDTSSRPRQDLQHSETKSSSTAELIPLKNTQTTGKNPTIKTTPPSTVPANASDKQVLLLSVRNLNYEGPRSSVEDSDEGCFSGCSMETTSMSANLSKEGHVQSGDSQTETHHTQIIIETQDKPIKSVKSDTDAKSDKFGAPETGQNSASGLLGAKADDDNITSPNDSQVNAPAISHTADKHTSSNTSSDKTTSHQDIQPAEDSPPAPYRNLMDRTSSLLQRLLMPRKRQQPGEKKDPSTAGKTGHGRKAKKGGAVKTIPSSTTLMMFVLTTTFVINYLPHLIIISMSAMSEGFRKGLEGAMPNICNIGLRSYFMNCAANSLVYGFCNARFRHECWLLFSRK